jgi:sulfate transport system permease protein
VKRRVLPGFGLTMGITTTLVSLLVLIPLAMLLTRVSGMGWDEFVSTAMSERARAAYWLSIWTALAAALMNVFCGFLLAWTLVRYDFVGRRLLDAIIDLPFALPTAVAGIALTALYSESGAFGSIAALLGWEVAYTPVGIVLAVGFVGLPFVVRTLQPVIEGLEPEVEEAAASLGAGRTTAFLRIVLPGLFPAILTGFALAFARGVGEYGSVIFIAGNMPMRTEIAPLLIVTRLEEFDYNGAAAIAIVMLTLSFVFLGVINVLQHWASRSQGAS